MGLEQLAALAAPHEGFDVVINATSASLAAQPLAVPAALLAAAALAYDMVYGAAPTPFMQAARLAGCPRQSDGLGMLVEQAAESFAWWRGVRPDTGAVLDAVRAALARAFDEDAIRRLVPMQRAGQPQEVADLVAFLASDRAAYISGQTIGINGALYQ